VNEVETNMKTKMPPFNIGQTVYIAWASAHHSQSGTCPVCFGQRSVTLILGDGERVQTPCRYCDHGVLGSTGEVSAYCAASGINERTVTGVQLAHDGAWEIQTDGRYSSSEANTFGTRASAEVRRQILFEEAEEDATKSYESRFRTHRGDHAWTIGYHRNQIKDLERQLEWHRDKVRTIKDAPQK
jgi:hypothetical protein